MAPHRRRALPAPEYERIRVAKATTEDLSAGGKALPLQGEVASAISGGQPSMHSTKSPEEANTAPPANGGDPALAPTSAAASAPVPAKKPSRKKVDPDSPEGQALAMYVESFVIKEAEPEGAAAHFAEGSALVTTESAADANIDTVETRKSFYCPIIKKKGAEAKRLVTSIVLSPEEVDAQKDIYSEDVIEKAAHNFLARLNLKTKPGVQHKEFHRPIDIVESWLAPMDMEVEGTPVKRGTWIMTMRVNDPETWGKIEDGTLTGFSIGGTAKVQKLAA